jgi:hypothetical protein
VGWQAGDRHALGRQRRLPVGLRRKRLARHALLAHGLAGDGLAGPGRGLAHALLARHPLLARHGLLARLARLRRPARLALAGTGASLRLGNARLRLQP